MGNHCIGRLKHSTNKRCPECGCVLQVRVRDIPSFFNGIPIDTPEEYIACSNSHCEYECDVEQKRRKLEEKNLTPKKPKEYFKKG